MTMIVRIVQNGQEFNFETQPETAPSPTDAIYGLGVRSVSDIKAIVTKHTSAPVTFIDEHGKPL